MQGRTLKANLSGGPAPKKSKADLEMELIIVNFYQIEYFSSKKYFFCLN